MVQIDGRTKRLFTDKHKSTLMNVPLIESIIGNPGEAGVILWSLPGIDTRFIIFELLRYTLNCYTPLIVTPNCYVLISFVKFSKKYD